MKNVKYTVKPTTQFKKDYKLAMRRGLDIRLLEGVIADLAMGIPLPEKNRDHALSGNWAGHRECHVLPDWLLIYRIEDDVLVLTYPGPGRTAICSENDLCPPPYGVFPCTAFFLMQAWPGMGYKNEY